MLDAPLSPPNRLYALQSQLKKDGHVIADWVSGNVSEQGIIFPQDILQAAFQKGLSASERYQPDPLGQRVARDSICRYYLQEGLSIPPDQIVLTPGTSMAYVYAFKLLAEPGDEILCPTPNYPLFDALATFAGVSLTSYSLREDQDWCIDFDTLTRAITPKTRAIVLISPHNPTGAVASLGELERVAQLARTHQLAIISDEVFSPFLWTIPQMPHPASTEAPLVLTFNGLSKMLALPGLKMAWMTVTGDRALVKRAMQRLDTMSDTFLPVSEPTQLALPLILDALQPFLKNYVSTVHTRKTALHDALKKISAITATQPAGGFYTVMRLLRGEEEEVVCQILEKTNVLVHPGYFYDLEGNHLVITHVGKTESVLKQLPQVAAVITSG